MARVSARVYSRHGNANGTEKSRRADRTRGTDGRGQDDHRPSAGAGARASLRRCGQRDRGGGGDERRGDLRPVRRGLFPRRRAPRHRAPYERGTARAGDGRRRVRRRADAGDDSGRRGGDLAGRGCGTLAERVSRRNHRPLLTGRDPVKVLRNLAAARNPLYRQAHFHVSSSPAPHARTVDGIVAELREAGIA